MLKAWFNRNQDDIVIAIWIIGIIVSIYFFTNKEKYHIIPGSIVHSTYKGKPITYCKYIHDNLEGYIGVSNVSIDFCSNNSQICKGHPNDPFSRKALKGNWNKYEKQGYFTINRKWWLGLVIPCFCLIFMGIIYISADENWTHWYKKEVGRSKGINHFCYRQSRRPTNDGAFLYFCDCPVKDYCEYSDCPNKVFKYIRIYKNKFLGY